ncbi:hypothetical protein ACTHHL_04325 [Aeribacillus composti]|uniref:hypothetical protein n=1 Tax=Aeribacillus composti TaxID=1868734 RepID=UPI00406A4CBF
MLTKYDIELIKRTRAEIMQNRTQSVILFHKAKVGIDPFTNDTKYEEFEEQVEATWRRYTSESPGTDDIKYVNGVVAEVGDVFAEFDLAVDLSDVEKVKHVESGEFWRIRGVDKVGLGEPNRYYVLLGRMT